MPFLIFRVDGRELARRRLDRPLVIGRSPECDIRICDSLLSRQHCRFDHDGFHWIATDLQSRNGTWLGERRLTQQKLRHGDQLRLGIVKITYDSRAKDPNARKRRRSKSGGRPADPLQQIPILHTPLRGPTHRPSPPRTFPQPRPRPADPRAYAREDVYSLLRAIASSTWDSVHESTGRVPPQPPPAPRPAPRNR
jgi:pSer/pThr/pTyr-binding forkhead associated (FHA) protein